MPPEPNLPDLHYQIGAVVLAAGESRRMGEPKTSLPWGNTTVIAHVCEILLASGLEEIRVVTGGGREHVETSIQHLPVQTVFNPKYADQNMIHSLQTGISSLSQNLKATLIVLGDQPQVEVDTIRRLTQAFQESSGSLIVPSHHNRRGHPWLVSRSLWPEILSLQPPSTLRDFLNNHAGQIQYISIATSTILKDLDTPEDYARERPPGTH